MGLESQACLVKLQQRQNDRRGAGAREESAWLSEESHLRALVEVPPGATDGVRKLAQPLQRPAGSGKGPLLKFWKKLWKNKEWLFSGLMTG